MRRFSHFLDLLGKRVPVIRYLETGKNRSGLAFFLGGAVVGLAASQSTWHVPFIGATRPWQVIFFIVGLPGLLLALLMYTVREPARHGVRLRQRTDGSKTVERASFAEAYGFFLENWRTLACHNLGFALLSFSSYGSAAWIPTFFVRNHGWSESKAGLVYGTIVGIFGPLGIVAGGRLADWMAARGYRDANMRIGLIAAVVWMATGSIYPLVSDANLAAALLAPTIFFTSAPFGVAPAAIQQMMPNVLRGQASAIYLFVVNLIGLGLGPTAVALATDRLFRSDDSVRYSLLLVNSIAHVGATALLWTGLRQYRRSLDRLAA